MKSKRFISLSLMFMLVAGSFAGFALSPKESKPAIAFATYINHDADTYYDDIDDTKSGNDFLVDLRKLNLNRRKSTVGYKNMGTNTSGQFKYTDYDPDYIEYDLNGQPYGTKISSFYTYVSATSWNREHVWPNSHGGGSKGDAGTPYPDADIHMPRPTVPAENSSRGNSFFVEDMADDKNGWDPKTAGFNENSRGEAARITFYCTLVNQKLILAPGNVTPSGKDPITGLSYGTGHTMGDLITLIKWNLAYPVNQREMNRNEGAEYLQGNRNPFIDHPEYVCKIWGNANADTKALCNGQKVTVSKESASMIEGDTLEIYATSEASEITWSSSNESVLTLDKTTTASETNIKLTAVSAGTSVVTAKVIIDEKEYSATCSVTVSAKPIKELSSISLSGNYKTSFELGEDFTSEGLVVTANYTIGDSKILSNTEYALTEPDMTSIGTKKVNISYTEDEITKTASYNIVVSDPAIHVTSISLDKETLELKLNEQVRLTATILPENADNKEVVWSSSNESVATVSFRGLVSAKSVGEATITVTTVDGGLTATCKVKVVAPQPAGGGCGGSVEATSIILSTLSVLGIGLLLIKRKFSK